MKEKRTKTRQAPKTLFSPLDFHPDRLIKVSALRCRTLSAQSVAQGNTGVPLSSVGIADQVCTRRAPWNKAAVFTDRSMHVHVQKYSPQTQHSTIL